MPDEADKPPMPDNLRPLAEAAIRRHQKRPIAPEVVTVPEQRYLQHLTSPYRDEDNNLWFALLLECFGTRVLEVGQAFFRQLSDLCGEVFYEGEDHRRRDETELRQALAIVYDLKPRNAAEAAGAAQLVALHFATMKVGAMIAGNRYLDARTAASLAALSKAYSSQLRTIQEGRSKGRSIKQVIRIERVQIDARQQHLHAGEGGQESGSQPQGGSGQRARARQAVRGEGENDGSLLSLPCREGPEPLPIPRRGEGVGRA